MACDATVWQAVHTPACLIPRCFSFLFKHAPCPCNGVFASVRDEPCRPSLLGGVWSCVPWASSTMGKAPCRLRFRNGCAQPTGCLNGSFPHGANCCVPFHKCPAWPYQCLATWLFGSLLVLLAVTRSDVQSRILIGWRSLGPLRWLEMQAGTTLTTSDKELNQDDGVGFALSRGTWMGKALLAAWSLGPLRRLEMQVGNSPATHVEGFEVGCCDVCHRSPSC